MNPNLNHFLEVRFQTPGAEATSFEFLLRKIQAFLQFVGKFDRLLRDTEWLISTGDRDTSYLYTVFDANGPTKAALAVLHELSKKNDAVRTLSLWNGQEDRAKGASISCIFGRQDGSASSFKLSIRSPREKMRLGDWKQVAEALAFASKIFAPIYGTVETMHYNSVFNDRPGVGWMLYLPTTLDAQKVPEARALVPVMSSEPHAKEKQMGTIIVSVTESAFADDNSEHVKIANAIEVRLVDQDLLPRFAAM